jgi:NADP-dependent 3-hydroxy acid dehydrogenase YdfG
VKARGYEKVFITGASSGIGHAMARWWAQKGATVWAADKTVAGVEALERELNGRVHAVAMDVTRAEETLEQLRSLDDACGGLDLVIANAGIADSTPAQLASWEMVERVIDVNVMGAAATLTAVLPRMVARGRGHLTGVSSVAAYIGLGGYSAYCGSKAFFSRFMQSVRVDLRGTGVKVTCIEPGFVKSGITERIEGLAPMPFRAETDVAADRFCRAIVRGERTYAYPKVHAWPGLALRAVPGALYRPVARFMSLKQIRSLEAELAKGR